MAVAREGPTLDPGGHAGNPGARAGRREFSSSAALSVLQGACRQARLSGDGADLLRIGENAIFRLTSGPIVVRIVRSADRLPRVKRELCIARWLAAAQVPAVRVFDEIEQPLMVDGHPVSFWVRGDRRRTDSYPRDLARLLAAYHGAPRIVLVTWKPSSR